MTYLILVAVSLLLFVCFVALTMVEARTGMRVLAGPRSGLDRFTARVFFIAGNVNWAEFLSHTVQSFLERLLHDIAYTSLAFVRFIERQLTRTVRYLRDRRPNVLAPKPSREPFFSQTISYIQRRLHRSRTDNNQES